MRYHRLSLSEVKKIQPGDRLYADPYQAARTDRFWIALEKPFAIETNNKLWKFDVDVYDSQGKWVTSSTMSYMYEDPYKTSRCLNHCCIVRLGEELGAIILHSEIEELL